MALNHVGELLRLVKSFPLVFLAGSLDLLDSATVVSSLSSPSSAVSLLVHGVSVLLSGRHVPHFHISALLLFLVVVELHHKIFDLAGNIGFI